MIHFIADFQAWLVHFYDHLGYGHIVFMMALESSLFPVPAELVLIPAGYLSRAGELSAVWSVVAATGGSLIGASCNYLLGRTLGRAFLLRYGRWLLIDPPKYHKAEALFLRNANMATFIGRLLPVIRHLISLPAGTFRMHKGAFALWTCAGAFLMCVFLVALGWLFGPPVVDIASHYSHIIALAAIVCFVAWLLWFVFRLRRRPSGG